MTNPMLSQLNQKNPSNNLSTNNNAMNQVQAWIQQYSSPEAAVRRIVQERGLDLNQLLQMVRR